MDSTPRARAFFITGTDTEIGKTTAACALLAAARQRGLRTVGLKPVAAGCDDQGRNEDALALQAQCYPALSYEAVNPVALGEAIAPHLAAIHEGRSLEASVLAAHCSESLRSADFAVIEGAGGWRVPLTMSGPTLADVAKTLGFPVIMVVGMRLGCINHALLTAEAIAADGLSLAGWVANQPGARMRCHEENLATLQARLAAPYLGELPYEPAATPEQFATRLDLAPLLRD